MKDLAEASGTKHSIFENLCESLQLIELKRKQYLDVEKDLQQLDLPAWDYLKQKACTSREKTEARGWQPLFDILNQARGYCFLRAVGCSGIIFIAETDQKTPDIQAELNGETILCEVKTINISEKAINEADQLLVNAIEDVLGEGFLNKTQSSLEKAKIQMLDYARGKQFKGVFYLVLNFDDVFSQYRDNYLEQIEEYLKDEKFFWRIVLDSKPPYYAATRNAPSWDLRVIPSLD